MQEPTSVYLISWSPDGTRLITSPAVGQGAIGTLTELKIWDAASGEEMMSIAPAAGALNGAVWAPGGSRIVFTTGEGQLRILDTDLGAELLSLQTDPFGAHSIGGSPDGQHVVINAWRGTARVFRAWQSLDELIAMARECCVIGSLTPEERELYGLPPAEEVSAESESSRAPASSWILLTSIGLAALGLVVLRRHH